MQILAWAWNNPIDAFIIFTFIMVCLGCIAVSGNSSKTVTHELSDKAYQAEHDKYRLERAKFIFEYTQNPEHKAQAYREIYDK